MVGIYQDSFIAYLQDVLNCKPKITSKNIIVQCPWCEFGQSKDHYHLHISLEAPIFNCFHAGCTGKSGNIRKLIKKLEGYDISDKFIDKDAIQKNKKQKTLLVSENKTSSLYLPEINTSMFPLKEMYLNKRFKFINLPFTQIKGLVFDVYEFISKNNITITESIFRMKDYLQSNFVGFVTENKTMVVFRNIDESHSMRYFKLRIQDSVFTDYYKLNGNNTTSKKIILAEGIFDIFSDYLFNITGLKDNIKLYASVLSSKYIALIKSIIFHEQVFHPDVIILSDNGIKLEEYKKMKKYNNSIINSLTIYYNKTGKDFNDTPVNPVKFVF